MRLGVALSWHYLEWPELLRAVQLAEKLDFEAVFVDGDVTQLPSRGDAEILEGWTTTVALINHTERITIGSIRLVYHWNAARLAQAIATMERIAPGRLRFMISIGGQPTDQRFGFARLTPGKRIQWLNETLHVVRALWRGEEVSYKGNFVTVNQAKVRPVPPRKTIPIAVAGRGKKMLEVVATHADCWDLNLPPLRDRVSVASSHLADSCAVLKRKPEEIERSMWLFARAGSTPGEPGLVDEFKRLNPWFKNLGGEEITKSIIAGTAGSCVAQISEHVRNLKLNLPVVDLSGLNYESVCEQLESFAPNRLV